jgi:hypothetical protein
MKNARLRFGWLTYVKSTEKTTTSIKLRLDRFIGEALPDPPRQAKAHLISVIGGDTQIAAVSAAISPARVEARGFCAGLKITPLAASQRPTLTSAISGAKAPARGSVPGCCKVPP